ncbi:YbaB/EbfC family nucleoid-associated protein [Streptomyces panaciradicis]|uniref:YbaB/EbfC family nucleoid-associated protein n=1 Tax=Streptomyces panaciradicis TaxID=1470261 RepID=UPI00201D0AE0|nr:YbaB/EbfC family nucleoid-associated protein [Streptomyces panaciradicis]MCL6675201.1 YbaB/EbfC family nucleoid-associated protein [Streptomyces panaciradicis]
MEPVEERLAKAMELLESTRAAVADAEQRLRSAAVTVMSKDRSVEITVGPQGEVTALRFHDGKYRAMAPAQLSAVILQTLGQARSRMAQQVLDTYRPISEGMPQLTDVPGVEIDWEGLFGSMVAEGETRPGKPAGGQLRDEIVEDQETA